ncbi:MAG: nucleotidyltransferase domain-containing protein [Paenibacillus sp.]|uniref:nucleotidyltransferase domain-containing protein n=1 Tax=Paenibacillus sp. TaxID=58172 RepID=UPI0029079D4C|nr:nucleotidyltransferase domain-containing protein [Paenibacillus sp.]MDU4695339.1 nucleotidyltransferase domain-containing protein [Paenibacillus sp.]
MEQAGDTQSLILRRLRQVEQTEEVRILYACEAGSRAWAYASAASDYDVRFVYVRPVEWYLSIKDQRDVLEFPIHVGAEDDQREAGASGSSQPGNGGALDLVGWDLRKALLLLAKGNPALFEWLASPIVYADAYQLSLRLEALAPHVFSAKAAMHHYLHMAKRNLRTRLRGTPAGPKDYIYVLRPLLACAWIERCGSPPPMDIEALVQAALPPDVRRGRLWEEIDLLLTYKKTGRKPEPELRLSRLDEYFADRLPYYERIAPTQESRDSSTDNALYDRLDELFRCILQEVWELHLQ